MQCIALVGILQSLTRKVSYASFTFAYWHIAVFPSFVFVGGVTPNSRVVGYISTEVVISFISPFVSMRCLFWPFLTLPSRNCCWYLSLVIFSSFTILANFLTILTIPSSQHLCIFTVVQSTWNFGSRPKIGIYEHFIFYILSFWPTVTALVTPLLWAVHSVTVSLIRQWTLFEPLRTP